MAVFFVSMSGHGQESAPASGMTSGLPGVSPQREAELMHIRAQAEAARAEAEAAAIQRSAERKLDEQADQRLLQEARETKRLKEQASRDLQYQKAANAYKKVGVNEIESWNTSSGRVKVQQDVPREILAALPPEEEPVEQKSGFNPLRAPGNVARGTVNATKKAVSWVPFVGKKKDKIEPTATVQPAGAPPSYPPPPTPAPNYTPPPTPAPNYTPPPTPAPSYTPPPVPATAPPPAAPAPTMAEVPPPDPAVTPGNVMEKEKKGFFGKVGGLVPSFSREKSRNNVEAPPGLTDPRPIYEEEKKPFFKGLASNIPFVGKKDEKIEPPTPESVVVPAIGGELTGAPEPPPPVAPSPSPEPAPIAMESDSEFESGSLNVGSGDPVDSGSVAEPSEKKGFFKGLTSNIPFVGKKKNLEEPVAESSAIASSAAPPAPVPAPDVPLFGPQDTPSAAPAPPAEVAAASPPPAPNTASAAQPAEPIEPPIPEKPGLFGGLKSFAGKITPGKNNSASSASVASTDPGNIDASLFPQDGDPDQLMADTSAPAGEEKKKLKIPGISSIPSIKVPQSQPKTPPPPKAPVPKKVRTPVHGEGSDLYIVNGATAQFLQFGDSQLSSQALSLQPGTVVRMTKVGDEWSSIELSNGARGIVKNKALRPAKSTEVPAGMFPGAPAAAANPDLAARAPARSSSGTARITRTVSATGAAEKKEDAPPGPPVSIPESSLVNGSGSTVLPSSATASNN